MWTDYLGSYRTVAQIFDASHNKVGGEFVAHASGSIANVEGSVTALDDGGFVITWAGFVSSLSYEVIGQRFDSAGQAVGASFVVNTESSGQQRFVSSATLSDGSFVVTWSSDGQDGSGYGIFAQRYDATATAIGSEFQVNTHTADLQFYGDIAALSDGGFVITWTSGGGQDGSGNGIYGQRYNAAGTAVGGEFQINTSTEGGQFDSSVSALAGGGFVVTWTSDSLLESDGSGKGIFGQRYDAAGMAVGGEFQVNVHVTNDQSYSSTLALQDGGFLVSWQSNGEDGDGWGIFARRYDAGGNAIGNAFQVNKDADGSQYHNRQVGGLNEFYDNSRNLEQLANGQIVFTWVLGRPTNQNDIEGRVFTLPISGTWQADTLSGTALADVIFGLGGADSIQGLAGDDQIFGGWGHDTLQGGAGNDTLQGDQGNDLLNGDGGKDLLFGGAGDDTLNGGWGNDRLEGNDGNDALYGDGGNDTLLGGVGNDLLDGGAGNDLLRGGAGNDTLVGGAGNDRLFGDAGDDVLHGDAGNDTLQGNAGNDTLYGGEGEDLLIGGAGDDVLYGGDDNDEIIAGGGTDVLTGGAGNDVFIFASAAHIGKGATSDRITDFTSGADVIDLTGIGGLVFIGTAGFSGTVGEVRLNPTTGALLGDLTGNGAVDFRLLLDGVTTLDPGDLLL